MTERGRELILDRELLVRSAMPNLHGSAAARMASVLEPRDFAENSHLFRAGSPSDEFFLIAAGQVAMELDGHAPWVFGPRSLVGMIDMNLKRPHRRSCRATRPTRTLVGRSRWWDDLAEDDPLIGNTAVLGLSTRQHELWKRHGHLLPSKPVSPMPAPHHPMPLHEKVLVLRETEMFKRAGAQALASLGQIAEELAFPAGEEVFPAGHIERALFVVVTGLVELTGAESVSGPARVDRCGPLSVVGAAAALAGQLGEYSARAVEPSTLLYIRDDDYYDQAEEHRELVQATLAYLAAESEALLDLVPPND
jgi:CRP-like cAMP-binding protein